MHVLDAVLDAELAAFDGIGDILQRRKQLVKLLAGQKPDRLEHTYVGHRSLDIVARKTHVELAVLTDGEILY